MKYIIQKVTETSVNVKSQHVYYIILQRGRWENNENTIIRDDKTYRKMSRDGDVLTFTTQEEAEGYIDSLKMSRTYEDVKVIG